MNDDEKAMKEYWAMTNGLNWDAIAKAFDAEHAYHSNRKYAFIELSNEAD